MRRINARISGADTGDADTEMGVPSDIGALDQRQLLSLLTRRGTSLAKPKPEARRPNLNSTGLAKPKP